MMVESKSFHRQSGQGTVEYLLVLATSVVIIGTIIYQYNSAFKVFAESYFGGYVACLMEVGELPGAAEGVCDFQKFDLAKGDPSTLKGEGGAGGASGQGGSGGDTAKNREGEDPASGQQDEGSSGASEAVASGSASSGGRASSMRVGRARGAGRQEVTRESPGAGGENPELNAVIAVPNSLGGGQNDSRSEKVTIITYGNWAEEQAELEKERPAVAKVASSVNENARLRPKKAIEPQQTIKPRAPASDDSGFDFGDIIRFMIIAAIVIAILVFFGGQALQISKSWEK